MVLYSFKFTLDFHHFELRLIDQQLLVHGSLVQLRLSIQKDFVDLVLFEGVRLVDLLVVVVAAVGIAQHRPQVAFLLARDAELGAVV